MHVVLCSCAGRRYAISTQHVREVISLVRTTPVPDAPPWLSGLINYHGQLVPLVDVPCLLGCGPWELRRTCRILVVGAGGGDGSSRRWVGLLVQSVLDCDDVDFHAGSGRETIGRGGREFLGPVAVTEDGTVQLIEVVRLTALLEPQADEA